MCSLDRLQADMQLSFQRQFLQNYGIHNNMNASSHHQSLSCGR